MARPSVNVVSSAIAWTCSNCRQKMRPSLLPSLKNRPWMRYSRWPQMSSFSTSSSRSIDAEPPVEIRAAPEIKFDKPKVDTDASTPSPARIIPSSPSYFTGSPTFTDDTLLLQSLVDKYSQVPTVAADQIPRAYWVTVGHYRSTVSERVTSSKFARLQRLLGQLNRIHRSFMPEEVQTVLQRFTRPGLEKIAQAKVGKIDQWGRSLGVGRRKESTARVWLVEGTGEVLVNGRSITEAFPRLHDRESALWALSSAQRMDKYNVFALIQGGGLTGQAESMTLALAKALLVHEPALKPALRRAGCVTSDARRVERKKPGRVKARKRPTWVKR
ncbi:hypothetical protein PV10_05639 [Exophiala mesophila]|uniref:Small ribosomal subunit protein uS9m n=1 Tax=Exophiala mesophila TaxID=212818 RepID=A0A0D1ZAR8_EXOME|nr:uncharacterized protein PV10_05639 [Exophiala mesophila]KIV91054.1 hypothetical protein PV10_05639 [Exophiala mesophila]